MLITHQSRYSFQSITEDWNNLDSNCNTISFVNCGLLDCVITASNPDGGGSYTLKPGASLDLGQRIQTIITQKFNVAFVIGVNDTIPGCVNIIRETFLILT